MADAEHIPSISPKCKTHGKECATRSDGPGYVSLKHRLPLNTLHLYKTVLQPTIFCAIMVTLGLRGRNVYLVLAALDEPEANDEALCNRFDI